MQQTKSKKFTFQSGLKHRNIVELLGVCIAESSMLMITEFLPCGNLYNFLRNKSQTFDFRFALQVAMDVAEGMNFLHSTTPTILHRDLKSPNILVI
jgi:serine/threonine protein kinase